MCRLGANAVGSSQTAARTARCVFDWRREYCCIFVMPLFKGKYRTGSIRLPDWDYSSNGYYFVTICTNNRKPLFGNIIGGKIILNEYGKTVQTEWLKSPQIRRETNQPCPHMKPKSLSTFINGFKSTTTKQINQLRKTPGMPVWQPNYYESIIRDEKSLRRIRDYIKNNIIDTLKT